MMISNCRVLSTHDHSIVHRIEHWFSPFLLGCLLAFSPPAFAHPMHFHQQPLDAETIERTLDGMDRMVALLDERRGTPPLELPEGAMGVAVLAWLLPREVAALDEATLADSELLNDTLTAAGYDNPETAVYDWKIDAERILEAWEVLDRNLDMDQVNAAFDALAQEINDSPESGLSKQEALLFRDEALVRTTRKDIEIVDSYRSRISALLQRLGLLRA